MSSGKQGGGHCWWQRQHLAQPLSTALSPHTMEKLGPGYLSVISAASCAAKLLCTASFLFFSCWVFGLADGRRRGNASQQNRRSWICGGLVPVCLLALGWLWAAIVLFFLAFSTLKFTNLMPDYFLFLTVLQNWDNPTAILGSALHSQRCHWQFLDRRKLRLKSREYFLPYIVLEDYFWHTGRSHKITIKLILANSICDLKYSRGVCQASENWWQVSLPD